MQGRAQRLSYLEDLSLRVTLCHPEAACLSLTLVMSLELPAVDARYQPWRFLVKIPGLQQDFLDSCPQIKLVKGHGITDLYSHPGWTDESCRG